jgi:N-acetyl-anhydromuramyl-L-alanine amidase AmpD
MYPQSIWRPGPPNKTNGGVNTCRGVVLHSMVGSLAAALGELDKPARRASWHYSVTQAGKILAHYPDRAQTWHAGSNYNNTTIGIEHEGGLNPFNEPLTPVQLGASVALVNWLSAAHGFPMVRKVGLWEHNEVSGSPTACPSGRIPWAAYAASPSPQPEPPKEDCMRLFWCVEEVKLYLVGGFGCVWVAKQDEADSLRKQLGPESAVHVETINAIKVAAAQ